MSEVPPYQKGVNMPEDNHESIEDLGGYIMWALENDIPYQDIVLNIAHDLSLMIKYDSITTYKTKGYRENLPKYRKGE